MEELFEHLLLAFQELDVVEQEHVDAAIARLELVHPLLADPLDEVIEERFRAEIHDLETGL